MPPAILRENPPVCEKCANTRLQKFGVKNNRQCYYCPVCKRTQNGYPLPEPKPELDLLPCPKCRGNTRIVRTHGRRHQLICTQCRHNFTDVYINSPSPRRSEGPFHHKKTFAFDAVSWYALHDLCQEKKMSPVQALRFLLHEQVTRPLGIFALSRTVRDPLTGDSEFVTRQIPIAPNLNRYPPQTPLPNAFPAALREMRQRFHDQARVPFQSGNPCVVGIVGRINLCMDDRAKQGLLIAIERYRCDPTFSRDHPRIDHQTVLRRLLIDRYHAKRLPPVFPTPRY